MSDIDTTNDLTFPAVHMNGTSKGDLIQQNVDAAHAVQKALDALGRAAPNGRDFYVIDSDAYSRAVAEHAERMRRLRAVSDELQAIAWDVSNQRS